MSVDSTNVTVGKPAVGGAVSVAATTATLPTSASTTLTGFTNLGYVSDAGVTLAHNMDSNNVKAWGGDVVLSGITGVEETIKLTLIEAINVDVLKEIYGANNVTGTLANGISVTSIGTNMTARAWVIDMIMTGGVMNRLVIPNGIITEIGDVVYNDSDAVGYEVTIHALPNAAGARHYEYFKK